MQGKKKIFKYIFFSLLLFFLSTLFIRLVRAQEATGIAISPPTFEISANPGETIQNQIKVQNLTDRMLSISVDRRNFTALGEEGQVGLTEEETPFSLASWITVSPSETDILANQTKVFVFTIDIPANAEPGGHFGSIVFQTGGRVPEETGAAVAQEVGALVLLRLSGRVTEEAETASFSTKKDIYEYGPVDFVARVENKGNVHVKPTGTITIYNTFGRKISTVSFDARNVLPGAIRKIPGVWDRKFLFGRYTATATLVYGSENKTLTATTSFIGFPYKIAGVVFIILLIIGVPLYRRRKRIREALRILFGR